MGRVVRRVPLDFAHPLNEVWPGFLMPDKFDEKPCPEGPRCLNGYTSARAWVQVVVRLLLQLDDDRYAQARGWPMHPYFDSLPTPSVTGENLMDRIFSNRTPTVPRPSADIAEFGTGLAGRESSFMGHDSINSWRATDVVITAAGLDPNKWGICPACGGHASVEAYPGQRAEADLWQPEDPPEGEGWQLWENVTEGSPISPVFDTAQALARWLATPEGAEANNQRGAPMPYEAALEFVMAGHSFTFYGDAGGIHEGSEYVGTRKVLDAHEAPDEPRD